MKITNVEIGEYRQFKNISFDFTYPEGHPKAGQPLDKVCFIGQSGTGKTTLLNIIWDFFQVVDSSFQRLANRTVPEDDEPYETFRSVEINCLHSSKSISLNRTIYDTVDDWSGLKSSLAKSGYTWLNNTKIYEDLRTSTQFGKLGLYIDEAAVSASKNLFEERELGKRELVKIKDAAVVSDHNQITSSIIGLSQYASEVLWSSLLGDIDIYDESLKQFAAKLVGENSFSADRLVARISQWQKEHPNPRADIAEKCLNKILTHFHLEVDTAGTESRIVLANQQGKHIKGNYLSTGTKQLIATSLPIYKTNLSEGVVLFDEPERSLFPDIQRELIKYYTGLAPEAQFFFATHSPIIAAAFEPCERFILYFDENGEVKCRNGVAPIGDDPNDVLRKDFWMNPLMHEEGVEAYRRYLALTTKIRNEADEDKKNELILERLELGNRYNFAGQHAPY
nr:AAA family ATPase [uncultured Arsenicibacter sp.]